MDKSVIIKVKEKFIVLPSLWSDDKYKETIEVFRNFQLEEIKLPKNFFILTRRGTGKILMVIESACFTLSNLLANNF